jgi:hypothetical protein
MGKYSWCNNPTCEKVGKIIPIMYGLWHTCGLCGSVNEVKSSEERPPIEALKQQCYEAARSDVQTDHHDGVRCLDVPFEGLQKFIIALARENEQLQLQKQQEFDIASSYHKRSKRLKEENARLKEENSKLRRLYTGTSHVAGDPGKRELETQIESAQFWMKRAEEREVRISTLKQALELYARDETWQLTGDLSTYEYKGPPLHPSTIARVALGGKN